MHRAIIGGTFDPPHLAHLVAADTAYHQLDLDEVLMMPAGSPWQKASATVSAAQDRWAMTQLATEAVDHLVADDREVRRDGWTYTADTLHSFDNDDKITLILGADAAANLSSWDRSREVLDRVQLAVAPRFGIEPSDVENTVGSVIWLDMPRLDISGTTIRERSAAGQAVRFLVRQNVYDYMIEHGLYEQ